MQPATWLDPVEQSLGGYLPTILAAVAVLLIGWIVALIGAAVTRKILAKLKTNERLSRQTGSDTDFQRTGGRIVFWIIFLVTLIASLGILQVQGFVGPLTGLVNTLVPAIILAVVAWLVATLVRFAVNKALAATDFDRKMAEPDERPQPLSKTMGNVAYWLVLLLFLPAIVGTLGIDALTVPLSNMIAGLLGMLPNLIAAAIIAVVGWIVAKVLREVVSNLVAATGADRAVAKHEEARGVSLSKLAGTVVFILVIIPTIIAALDALQIEAISAPLTAMLHEFLLAVPNILAAAVILLLAWFIGRFVADLLTRLLASVGFDQVPARIGLGHAFASSSDDLSASAAPAGTSSSVDTSRQRLSELAGKIALFFIMLFATVEAAGMLGFEGVRILLEMFIAFGADILLGLLIFAVGFWLANLAATAMQRANPEARGMARIARFAILGLVIALGLGAMGVADQIVNLAFGLVLGAIAVAAALAFGLGGREAASQVTQQWASKYLNKP